MVGIVKKDGIKLYFNEFEDAARDYTDLEDFSGEDDDEPSLALRLKFIQEHHKILQRMMNRSVNGYKLNKQGHEIAKFLLNKYEESVRYGCAYAYLTMKDFLTAVAEDAGYEVTDNKIRAMHNCWINKTEEILTKLEIIEFGDKDSALDTRTHGNTSVIRVRLRSLFKFKERLN
ncbi:hypothetical protein ESZ36_17120 [Colwellia demingiae]|uniref:Uncharacterized protein n=1 Tax=Colwellia demingiae TaxID=89401 RepID=A0A5C6QA92_9GAMM|nr:hypothetical protein [Colwellia demingiae]TWX65527.1 hypothetical protein ESZ36_17120 [Colwellia demingiae]